MPYTVEKGIHHVAYACKDVEATHRFYSELMGFDLVYTEIKEYKGGWFRHLFYNTGSGGLLAFFDAHGVGESDDWDSAISTGNGLPVWINHIAFAASEEDREAAKARFSAAGIEPLWEADHDWLHSVYYLDPNGIMVEFCTDTPGAEPDPAAALQKLRAVPTAFADGVSPTVEPDTDNTKILSGTPGA